MARVMMGEVRVLWMGRCVCQYGWCKMGCRKHKERHAYLGAFGLGGYLGLSLSARLEKEAALGCAEALLSRKDRLVRTAEAERPETDLPARCFEELEKLSL